MPLLDFQKTVNESQLLTEDNILMDVNQRPNGIFAMTLRMLFVAYARVKPEDNVHVLSPITGYFNHLMKFHHDTEFVH